MFIQTNLHVSVKSKGWGKARESLALGMYTKKIAKTHWDNQSCLREIIYTKSCVKQNSLNGFFVHSLSLKLNQPHKNFQPLVNT